MEFDRLNGENSDQLGWSTPDYDQDSSYVRSYRCSFCQKGFSSAQALGGHMNIHRKDRARCKEFLTDKSTLSLDITKKPQSQSPPRFQSEASSQLELSDERCCTPKRPYTSPIEIDSDNGVHSKDDFGDKLQLSLSIETSSSSNEKDESISRVSRRHVKRSMQLNQSGASQTTTGLDLELRLGPEPHEAGTKG